MAGQPPSPLHSLEGCRGAGTSRSSLGVPKEVTGPTVFDRILAGEIPAEKVYEDDKCLAIWDVNPVAPVHMLILPKLRIQALAEVGPEHDLLLGHLLRIAAQLAKTHNLERGYRVVINNGHEGGQAVYYLHVHLIGGKQLAWPPC